MKKLLAIGCMTLTFGVSLHAQPLIEHVPADALIYAGWQGVDELGEAYEQSTFKAVLDATELGTLFTETLPALMEEEAQNDPDAAEALAFYRASASAVWHRPWAFYSSDVRRVENQQEPLPRFGLLCSPGEHAEALRAQFERLAEHLNNETPELDARVEMRDDVLCLLVGPEGEGKLSGNPDYQAAVAHITGDSAVMFYIDMAETLDAVQELAESQNDPALGKMHAVIHELGLDDLKHFVGAGGFEGKGWRWEAFIGAPTPRRGLLAAIESKPIGPAQFAPVPITATWLQVSQLDLGQVLTTIENALTAADDNGQLVAQYEQGLAEANAELGVDLTAMLRSFGPQWVMYADPGLSGWMGLSLCILNQPRDAQQLETDLTTIEQLMNREMAGDGGMFRFTQMQKDDLTIHTYSTPFISPSWAMAGGNLLISLTPQSIQMADVYAKQDTSILDNEKFRRLA